MSHCVITNFKSQSARTTTLQNREEPHGCKGNWGTSMKIIGELLRFLGRTEILLGILIGAIIVMASTSHAAGTTANGCSYKVINGKYHYNCEAKSPSVQTSVPGYYRDNKPAEVVSPSLARATSTVEPTVTPARMANTSTSQYQGPGDDWLFLDKVFVGGQIGGLGLTTGEGSANTATSFGVGLSADLNHNFGFELSYTYAGFELFMGLMNRSPEVQPSPFGGITTVTKDAEMVSHHVVAEGQYFLTSSRNKFRPFAGAGIFWRRSTIEETLPANTIGATNSEFSQTSFGIPLSAGLQVYFNRTIRLNTQFRYLQPIFTSDAQIDYNQSGTGASAGVAAFNQPQVLTLFNENDEDITGSAAYQLSATLQFSF